MSPNDNDHEGFSVEAAKALYEVSVPLTVGRATVSWNTLSGAIFMLYRQLSGMDEESAKATFFCVTSDRSQRDMVSALVQTKIAPQNPSLAKKVQRTLGKVNSIAGRRNDILHVVYREPQSPTKVHQFYERGHLKGQSGDQLLASIHEFGMEALDLASEVLDSLSAILDHVSQPPLPKTSGWSLGSPLQWTQERANQEEYGLLDVPAKTSPSQEEGDPG